MVNILHLLPQKTNASAFIFANRLIEALSNKGGLNIDTDYIAKPYGLNAFKKLLTRFRSKVPPNAVVIHYGSVFGLACVIASSILGFKTILYVRGSDLNPNPDVGVVRGAVAHLCTQIASMLANQNICVSKELCNKLWTKHRRNFVLPSGVNLDKFYPIKNKTYDRSTKILFNRGPAPGLNKGIELLESVSALLKEENLDVKINVLTGDTPPEKLPEILRETDILLFLSKKEGSPNIIKEALASNVCIISTDVGDVREICEKVKGVFIVGRNPKEILEKIRCIIQHKIISDGRSYSVRFDEKIIVERFLEIVVNDTY